MPFFDEVKLLKKQVTSEFKKSLVRKSGTKAAKVLIMAVVLISLGVFMIMGLISSLLGSSTPYTKKEYTKQEIELLVVYYELNKADVEDRLKNRIYSSDQEHNYQIRLENINKNIETLRYLIDEKIDTSDYTVVLWVTTDEYGSIFGLGNYDIATNYESIPPNILNMVNQSSFGSMSWSLENFTTQRGMFSVIYTLLIIYTAILTGSVFGDDYRRKTIRMLALRPITRNRILLVKTLTVALQLLIATAIAFGLQLVFTALSVGLDFTTVIISFGGKPVVLHPLIYIPWLFINQYLVVLFYMTISIALCVIFKSKIFPIIAAIAITQSPVVVNAVAIANGWGGAYKLTFFPHTDLNSYFARSVAFTNMNYAASLFNLAIYAAIFTFLSYWIFNKRDIE